MGRAQSRCGAILSFTLPLADYDETPEDDFREDRA